MPVAALVSALVGLLGVALALGRGGFLGWIFALFLVYAVRLWRSPRPGDGRRLATAVGSVFAGIVLLFTAMLASWETAEVIVLRQLDAAGEPFERRLWIIDLDGTPSFAARAPSEHTRIALLEQHPKVELVRGGRTECRMATLVPFDERSGAEVERLYDEKYGFRTDVAAELIVFLIGGAAEKDPVLVQLLPCPTTG